MKLSRVLVFLLTVACLGVVGGCGGGGGGGGGGVPSSATASVAGVVADGPLQGATVFLRRQGSQQTLQLCGSSGAGLCETKTDAQGNFSFQLGTGADRNSLQVVAVGGSDRETGFDFTGMTLASPVAMFAGNASQITVSPVTTLVAAAVDGGASVDEAETQTRQLLGVAQGTDLGELPSQDTVILRRSLLLTKIAGEIRTAAEIRQADNLDQTTGSAPFQAIGALVGKSQILVNADGQVDGSALSALALDAAARQRIAETYQALSATSQNLAATFGQEEIAQGLAETLGSMLQDSETFDPQNATYRQNLDLLAGKIRQALGGKILPLGGVVPQRLARYVLYTYHLTSFDRWVQDSVDFASALVRQENGKTIALEEDPKIGKLADIKALYSVSVPLLPDELPGNDNLKRLEYYYNSDASPYYIAEKVIGGVFDDQLSDAVMVDIVKGESAQGLLDQARTIIETQIFQSGAKADAYRAYALNLIRFGRTADAVAALKKAEALYREVIAAKGAASLASADAANLQSLAADYRQAGDLSDAQNVLTYLDSLIPYLNSYITFGRLVTGTRDVADAYLQEGRADEAAPVIDSMYALAQQIPPNEVLGTSFYALKVYFLVETAMRYAEIGDAGKVLEITDLVQSIRANDGLQNLTANETWPYFPELIDALYQVGATQRASALAASIPDSYQNFLGRTVSGKTFQKKAYKLVATYEALNNGLQSALTVINQHFSEDTDKIEALTYFALNKKSPYVALTLIDDGQLATAKQALDLAASLVAGLSETGDRDTYVNMIEEGYVKIADLYHEAGDDTDAGALLSKAEALAAGMSGVEYRVKGLTDIASGDYELGETAHAAALLDQAASAVGTATALQPLDSAALYDQVIQADLAEDRRDALPSLLSSYVDASRQIFDPTGTYAGTAHDTMAGDEVDHLVAAAADYSRIGRDDTAIGLLDDARSVIGQIYVAATAMKKNLALVVAYCQADDLDAATALANSLPYANDRYSALEAIAEYYAQKDDFPDTWVAGVDTDKDGKPDFFNPLATPADIAASGLVLDQDSDGDGIPDTADLRPFYPDN